MNNKAFSAIITGRVQGVGFRWSAMDNAHRLGLKGFVRNTDDGNVEVWAEGGGEQLKIFLKWLEHGPPSARVSNVQLCWNTPSGFYSGFKIEA